MVLELEPVVAFLVALGFGAAVAFGVEVAAGFDPADDVLVGVGVGVSVAAELVGCGAGLPPLSVGTTGPPKDDS
jgi:hypothetical protein